MKSLTRIRTGIAALAVFCAAAAGLTAYAGTTSTTVPVDAFSTVDPCTGDTIVFTGKVHMVEFVVTDKNGGTHEVSQLNNADLSGTGPTGINYRAQVDFHNAAFTSQFGCPQEFTQLTSFNVISQGPGGNSFATSHFHFTTDANCNMTASVTDIDAECRGSNTP